MSWALDSVTYQETNSPILHVRYGGVADASDLADQAIVDLSALTYDGVNAPTSSEIIAYKIAAGGVTLLLEWEHTADDLILVCPPGCVIDKMENFDSDAAKALHTDPGSSGGTGDIVATTTGGAAGDGVWIELIVRLLA